MKLPEVRVSDIVEQPLGAELLLYDLKINKAYSLNETSALIYRHCDGQTTFGRLREKHRGLSDDVILLAIDELDRAGLLAQKFESTVTRRSMLQKAAVSAVALPIIISLTAPTSAQAQSCAADGQPCSLSNPAACCSLTCVNGSPTPTCGGGASCTPSGGACDLFNPAACCSLTCINGSPNPTCQ